MIAWPYPPVMSHRCGGALAPENTLVGLPITKRLGCRGVEFDVMLSGSGTPVLIHDETLERTTTGVGEVGAMSDEQLARLDAGIKFHKAFAGTRLPTFAAAIAACRALDLVANVEIKPAAGFERATGIAVARMAAAGWADAGVRPLLSSFSLDALFVAAEVAPDLPRGLLFDRLPADWRARCAGLGVVAVHLNSRHLDAPTAHAVTAAGYRLAVYTENDLDRARRLWTWGVDMVITDRPDIVQA